jgi:hypothetical protein
VGAVQPNSEVRFSDSLGILALNLQPGAYSWQFVPVAGAPSADAGTGTCH